MTKLTSSEITDLGEKVPILYLSNFISEPDKILSILNSELDWERRSDAPRSEYYCNDFLEPYTYGVGKGRRTYSPNKFHPEISKIRSQLENLTQANKAIFEACFLNRYLNQSDHLGWHSDDSPEMDNKRPIATISLGVEREIWFRKKGSKEIFKLLLENGSLCLMCAGMQEIWQHRIPKASFQCGERISLTFRGYLQNPN